MSGGNSWTILTSEETVAETLKPLTGGADQHEESQTSAADCGEAARPANGAESADALHVDDYLVSEEKPAALNGDSTDQHTTVTDSPVPSCIEVSARLVHCDDEVGDTQVPSDDQAQFSPDPDSFSDSYTHVTPSADEPPASPLSTETLGSAEFSQEEDKLSLEATLHPLNGEKLHQDEEESDSYLRTTDLGKQAEPAADSEAADEKTGEEDEPEVRKRRSLLAALEQIGQREEDEVEEEFQLPQREDGSGFSVNKCILGAVILLGLGTIFFSESDYTRELNEAAAAGKQEWLNPEVPPDPVGADSSALLNKLAEGTEQISVLQAQLQAQKDELKVAMGQAAEGAKERLRWEEVEKENSRLKTEVASLPVLLKENERMKKELESIPALQKEVETLRSTVTELKLSSAAPQTEPDPVELATAPPGGQPEDSKPETAGSEGRRDRKQWDERKEKKKDPKRDKHDTGEVKDWKERDKSVWKEGEKREHKDGGKTERKKVIREFDKDGQHRKHGEETKHWKEKDWKKDKDGRGDEGKSWKNRDGKKEWREKSEGKEWKDEKDRKKVKSEKVKEGKQWRGKGEDKDWRSGEKQRSKEEWKKTKDGYKEGRKDKEWKNKNDKDQGKEGRGRGERKQWEGSTERSGKEERKRLKEQEWKSKNGKHEKEWKRKDKRVEEEDWKKEKKHGGGGTKDKSKKNRVVDDHGHLYGERKPSHSHRKPSVGEAEYWVQQKDRLHHDPKPPQQCDSVEACAQRERLRPVPLAEFEAVLQTYLAKAQEAGVDRSKMEELQKLTPDFFRDGVFVHDKISFQDFVEDVGDILEDMVEVDEDGDEEDSAIEEEMEGFEQEVMKTFSVAGDKERRSKGEWRKESVPGRG
ncbi:pre-B-cell leukemia homeobox interacting protein 1b isoform X3 [Salarias fasciatus]|uniref:pre-B-cell leukemia homeobox interacting protein 1b isoform X3 n=1 Tax=Salarias fasciatus TaxID=181472 RepID=UPI0011764D47|nr:pre-B-cell leukemia transcription factor-interacting protein 1 isoform X3 [Salarias fasciatus]